MGCLQQKHAFIHSAWPADNHLKNERTLRKQAYSNTLKVLLPKNEKFQIKNSDMFSISAQKHRLWQF